MAKVVRFHETGGPYAAHRGSAVERTRPGRGPPPRRGDRRTFKFADFKEGLEFVDQIGALAEAEGHHPDTRFGWGYCTVELYTHKIKGLHQNDFIMAAKIDELARA
jgi:pterin-4a-carbinolamine dehydratase